MKEEIMKEFKDDILKEILRVNKHLTKAKLTRDVKNTFKYQNMLDNLIKIKLNYE